MVTTIATARLRDDVRWMTVSPDGTVYLVDLRDLVQVGPDGSVRTPARGLADRGRSFLFFQNRHAVMGLWTDARGGVYVAVLSDGVVRRVGPDGRVEVVARSEPPWSPKGDLVTPEGDLWLLEYGGDAARAGRVGR